MPVWCRTPNVQAAKGEIEIESSRQGWDLLNITSSKGDMAIAQAQRRKFVPHLERAYPDAQKDTTAWLQFIKKTTGQSKQWNSVSNAYTQASNQTHNATHNATTSEVRLKRKAGAGLSPDSRTVQGLHLTPREEKLVARQVNVPCVCTYVMAVVCALCMC